MLGRRWIWITGTIIILSFLSVWIAPTVAMMSIFILPQLDPRPQIEYNYLVYRAEGGDPEAQLSSAQKMHHACKSGCAFAHIAWEPTCDQKMCRRWYEQAASAGIPEAQTSLGLYYLYGNEDCKIEKDVPRGLVLLNSAADQEHVSAYMELAKTYADGAVVQQNDRQAVQFYQKAADAGNKQAAMRLAEIYLKGKGVSKNTQKAREFGLMAQDTDTSNQFRLGKIYAETNPPNYEEAYYWISLARERWKIQGARGNNNDWPSVELEKHLNPEQIVNVNRRVSEWIEADKIARPKIYD